jgi:hypothetical protein
MPTPKQLQEYIDKLKAAADEAQDIVDYEAAHDEEIQVAISMVEEFLRRTKRICYGGQAINAYLPDKHKFYDPLRSIPDYDFLTPAAAEDIKQLVRRFKEAGFKDVSVREGMHEGTKKVYVNYIAVADVTEIHPEFYTKLYERSKVISGINYIDVNSLRMMMYLELSRPRGEVERWEKVFTRLALLNQYAPMKCAKGHGARGAAGTATAAEKADRRTILDYIVYEQRVFAGGDIISYYKRPGRTASLATASQKTAIEWFIGRKQPILFYSPTAAADGLHLKAQLQKLSGKSPVRAVSIAAEADFFPQVIILEVADVPICGIIQETACHAYNSIDLGGGKQLRVASFDTLITLYISLTFKRRLADLFDGSPLCLAQQVIELQELYRGSRREKRSPVPFISITCSGHQTRLASLLRAKVERIRVAKAATAPAWATAKRSRTAAATAAKGGAATRRKHRSHQD